MASAASFVHTRKAFPTRGWISGQPGVQLRKQRSAGRDRFDALQLTHVVRRDDLVESAGRKTHGRQGRRGAQHSPSEQYPERVRAPAVAGAAPPRLVILSWWAQRRRACVILSSAWSLSVQGEEGEGKSGVVGAERPDRAGVEHLVEAEPAW